MTNTKILTVTLAIASILVVSPIAMQSAFAGGDYVICSTDKFNPTIGDLEFDVIVIDNPGDDCYLGQSVEETVVFGIHIEDAGKVNIVNTEIGYYGTNIDGTTDKLKFKENELHAHALLTNNDVTHLEVMDNYVFTGYTTPEISVHSNTASLLKIVGNSIGVSMKDNTIDFFAFCKNNTPEVHSWEENTYNGKNKGCPTSDI